MEKKKKISQLQKVYRASGSINPSKNMLRCIEIKLTKSLRQRKNILKKKRKATNNIQGNSREVIS